MAACRAACRAARPAIRAAAPALALLLALTLAGCAHRLKGPNHGPETGAWIAPDGPARPPGEFELLHRVALIGDTGYYLDDDPTLAALGRWTADTARASVVFLGDNVYDEGVTDRDPAHGERILAHQLAATPARKLLIPGNHDWGFFSKRYDAKSIRNQQLFIDGWPAGDADFLPKDGCMGPERRILAPRGMDRPAVVLIALDPTPWIHPRLRRLCAHPQSLDAHLRELEALLAIHRDDFVIVASHYPLRTGGPHGGLSYGFPIDLLITPLGWMLGGLGNTDEPGYADWIDTMKTILRRNPPEIYAAGHDHNLQLLDAEGAAGLLVVSGAGAVERVSTVTHLPETRFAHAVPGFVLAELGLRAGVPAVRIRIVESAHDEPVFELDLPLDPPTLPPRVEPPR